MCTPYLFIFTYFDSFTLNYLASKKKMETDKVAIAPTEQEYRALVEQCHNLISVIAKRPGAVKLLRGILPTLQQYGGEMSNRCCWRSQK